MSGDDEKLYVCRKGYHALNIQAVADAKMRFINLNCKFPGSTHDAFVLTSSTVPDIMETLPEGGFLLGDSGYPLKKWLMTPVMNPSTPQEMLYNTSHSKTRAIVERAFGILKSRFRCIHKTGGTLPYVPSKCAKIIETTFRLHNKAIEDKIPLYETGEIINRCHNDVFVNYPQGDGQNMRQTLISRF
ncbi:putative nuclease HARBI1 [Gigantopelta aegis]|uniref:putative nuclease HARBI1 n=1 Tax=Gigantopelta aegis TaxID=1735272 RepID=UPI001B88823C|nr:putative nuclease HARBI1 [Gigantopelta aegis]